MRPGPVALLGSSHVARRCADVGWRSAMEVLEAWRPRPSYSTVHRLPAPPACDFAVCAAACAPPLVPGLPPARGRRPPVPPTCACAAARVCPPQLCPPLVPVPPPALTPQERYPKDGSTHTTHMRRDVRPGRSVTRMYFTDRGQVLLV